MKIISKSVAVVIIMATLTFGQSVIGYTSFEEPQTGDKYFDTGSASTDHALVNNDGQAWVMYDPSAGFSEMGFLAFYYNTLDDVGLTDGDYVGVTTYYPYGSDGYPDGSQGYQLSDIDGYMVLTFDEIDLSVASNPYFSMYYFVQEDGWETADFIKIWLDVDGEELVLLNTDGQDIDDLGIEGQWLILNADLSGKNTAKLHVGLQSNSANEAIYIDNIIFNDGVINIPPTASAGNDFTVRVNDEATLDGSESSDADGSIVSYAWTQLSGTNVTINNANTAVATFTAPASVTELTFRLEVTDNGGLSDADTVNVSVVEMSESFIIISEYVEGAVGNNKYLEIANIGEETIDLNSEGFTLGMAKDGSGNITEVTMDNWGSLGVLNPGDVIVLAADGHTLYTSPDSVLLYDQDAGGTVVHFNGNDAVAILKNGITVDIIGNPNSSEDLIKDMALRRKNSVSMGNPVFSLEEWIQLPHDDVSGLGMHGGADAPSFENATRTPEFVTSANAIEVSVDIIPGENAPAITAMDIEFGTGGSFLNSVGTGNTWNDHDNTWMGEIPAQAGNQKINYRFVAFDADGIEHRSGAYYVVIASATPTPIADIHTNIETWDGQIKTIHGVMTIGTNVIQTDRTNAYIQDTSGKGLNLYDPTLYADLERGAEVTVVGEVDLYYTTIELKNFSYHITATGQPLPDPADITVAGANSEEWEGTLIRVPGVVSKINSYSSNTAVTIKDGSDSLEVVFWNSTGIDIASLNVDQEAVFMGVGAQYASKFQLIVGYQEDFGAANSVNDNQAGLPRTFELLQPYPNPFNARATIQWSLPEAANVTVDVVNLTGQVVETLHRGHLSAGTYVHAWNADALASGIYVVRMRTAEKVFHKKLVLLK